MKIIINPNVELVTEIRTKLKQNDYYCPCKLYKIPENKCMCQEFRDFIEQGNSGECHCGLYICQQ